VKGEFVVRPFEKLSKLEFLFPCRTSVPRQLLVSEAPARGVAGLDLPFAHLSQHPDGFLIADQGQTKVGSQLPYNVVFRIITQHLQILLQSLNSLALLQQLLGAFYAPGHLGSVCTSGDFGHGSMESWFKSQLRQGHSFSPAAAEDGEAW